MSSTPHAQPSRRHSGMRALWLMILVIFTASVLLAWHEWDSEQHRRQTQQTLIERVAAGTTRELAHQIEELQRSVSLFAAAHTETIEALARDPSDLARLDALNAAAKRTLPFAFAVTLAHPDGTPVFEDFDGYIEEVCRLDIRNFAANDTPPPIYIHPNPFGYHFDIMTALDLPGVQGWIFFISFTVEPLANLLGTNSLPNHEMLLLRNDRSGLIEVGPEGARDRLQRDFFLSETDPSQLVYQTPVPGTLWEVAVLADSVPGKIDTPHPWSAAFGSLWILLTVGLAAGLLLRRSERKVSLQTALLTKQAEQLREGEDRLRRLQDITSSPDLDTEEKIRALLRLGCQAFDQQIGILARIEGQRYEVKDVYDSQARVKTGDVYSLEKTFCHETLRNGKPVIVEHAGGSGFWRGHPAYTESRLEAYLGVPLHIAGRTYGTLNFSSPEKASRHFGSQDREFLRLMAQWIGGELERHEAESELRAQHALLASISRLQSHFIVEGNPRQLFDTMLADMLSLSGSAYGFIGEVLYTGDGEPYLKTHALTNIAWNDETHRFYEKKVPNGLEFTDLNNLFGAVLHSGELVISNDPSNDSRRAGLPNGHPALTAFLGIPVRHGDQFIGMIGIANRSSGYQQEHVDFLQPLIATCGNLIWAFRNNNQRIGAETALRASEERLTLALDSTNEGLWDWNIATGDVYFSPRWQTMLGYEPGEVKPHVSSWEILVHPDDMPHVMAVLQDHLEGRTAFYETEHRVRTKSGDWLWILDRGKVVERDADGKPVRAVGTHSDITERNQAQQELKESEARTRAILETLVDAIITIDETGVIESVNGATEHIFGYRSAELIGQNVKTLMPEPYRSGHDNFVHRYMNTGEAKVIGAGREAMGRRKDGTLFPIELAVGEMTRHGERRFTGVVRDITQRKAADASLKLSEARLAEAQRIAHVGNWEWNIETGQLHWSDEIYRIFGLEPQQFRPTYDAFLARIHPADRDFLNTKVQGAIANGDSYVLEHRVIRPDGEERFVHEQGEVTSSETGIPQRMVGIVQDITASKKAQEELNRFKSTLDQTLDCVFMFEPGSLKFFYVNRGAIEQVGYSYDELLNMTPVDIKPYLDEAQFRALIDPLIRGTQSAATFETVHRSKTGKDIPVEIFLQYIAPPGETARFVAFVRDITERKKVERMKNEFISTVSHELRTPLTSIQGSLGLLAGGAAGELPERAVSLIDIAQKNSKRLLLLINDILDIEKIESGRVKFELKPTELAPLVQQAVEANRAYGEQYQVRFIINDQAPNAMVNVDGDRFTQVVTNLLSNAAKFSPPHAEVDITVARKDHQIRLTVTDHGPGIPEEFKPRLFQKFAQADASDSRQKGGTGLGLSISKAIAERLGGQIGYHTETGVGTRFFVDLPEWHKPDELPHTGNGPRILVCEDDPQVAQLLSLVLQHEGYTVDTAPDANECRKKLAKNDYAALSLDLMLPDQDGITLIKSLRAAARTRELPIIVVSAIAMEGKQRLNGGAYGVVTWLEKPFDKDTLLDAISRATGGASAGRPRVLYVEDDNSLLQVISRILEQHASVSPAATVKEAIAQLNHERFDLMLLDISLPDGSGGEVLTALSETPNHGIPVVVFSAQEPDADLARKVSGVLIKSRTSNEDLVSTITSLAGTTNSA